MPHRPNASASSLLDHLVDACQGVEQRQPVRIERLIDDIELLLNTCCIDDAEVDSEFPEVASSIHRYGSPAPQATSIGTHEERFATARRIEKTLRRFEPRLRRVRVRVEDPKSRSPIGRLRIEATLADSADLSLALNVRSTSGRAQITAERT
ncbi:GPW/gp25 family protein [Botrimarina mediterranea]|uniref:GPW/gp25 family protein n=1 Tax=Botrimarina mediterranea TaxID=2528022 RepID=UPI001188B189|nr:Gene 25-like lysozyme [Planctomycetes bacterium K2D]